MLKWLFQTQNILLPCSRCDGFMTWKCFACYWHFFRDSQRNKHCCFSVYFVAKMFKLRTAVEQWFGLMVIWDTMALMWRHSNRCHEGTRHWLYFLRLYAMYVYQLHYIRSMWLGHPCTVGFHYLSLPLIPPETNCLQLICWDRYVWKMIPGTLASVVLLSYHSRIPRAGGILSWDICNTNVYNILSNCQVVW